MADNRKINTYALWDNFKRDIDWELKEISAMSLHEKLEVFEKIPYRGIQQILKLTGKWLYKATVAHLWNKALDDKTGGLTKENFHEFSFYFWPGYDRLNPESDRSEKEKRNRVFISSTEIPNRPGQDYLTGIGVVNLSSIKDVKKFVQFIEGWENVGFKHKKREENFREIFDWDESKEFFYYNNPSSLAFDNALSSLNPVEEKNIKPPSTHYWKNNQRWKNKSFKYKSQFIPIRLLDGTELRFLEVSTESQSKPDTYNNVLKIKLDKDKLSQAGKQMAEQLSLANLPLKFIEDTPDKKNQKKSKSPHQRTLENHFINWPMPPDQDEKKNKYLEAQQDLYSFWISETLGDGNSDYSMLKERISQSEYKEYASRLLSFSKAKKYNPSDYESFYEVYFKYWYTGYMESYADEVDLGSIMILCSHDLNGKDGILHDIWHWVRWVFNELRLIESTTARELADFQRNYSILNHNIDFFLKYSNNLLKTYDQRKHSLHQDNLLNLSNILKMSLNFNDMRAYLHEEIANDNLVSVALIENIHSVLEIIENDIENNNGRLLKLNSQKLKSIKNKKIYEINNHLIHEEQVLIVPEVLSIVLKDIITNAIKNNFQEDLYIKPITIEVSKKATGFLLEIKNHKRFPKALKENFENNKPLIESNSLGLQIIQQIKKSTNLEVHIIPEDYHTKFSILIPNTISVHDK